MAEQEDAKIEDWNAKLDAMVKAERFYIELRRANPTKPMLDQALKRRDEARSVYFRGADTIS